MGWFKIQKHNSDSSFKLFACANDTHISYKKNISANKRAPVVMAKTAAQGQRRDESVFVHNQMIMLKQHLGREAAMPEEEDTKDEKAQLESRMGDWESTGQLLPSERPIVRRVWQSGSAVDPKGHNCGIARYLRTSPRQKWLRACT